MLLLATSKQLLRRGMRNVASTNTLCVHSSRSTGVSPLASTFSPFPTLRIAKARTQQLQLQLLCARTVATHTQSNISRLDISPSGTSSQCNKNLRVDKPVCITTPIFYVNGKAHIGHLFTALLGDALARWCRLNGQRTRFVTGTDEHGTKVQQAANKAGKSYSEFCDAVSDSFRQVFDRAGISYDDYVRTSEERHHRCVQSVWTKLSERGLIRSGTFAGWYSAVDEAFFPSGQVCIDPEDETKHIIRDSGHAVQWVEEPNYLFNLHDARATVEAWLSEEHPDRTPVLPDSQRRDALAYVRDADLIPSEISVSRLSERVEWGISVPNDPKHTVYVWLDALMNYLTACDYPFDEKNVDSSNPWPADVQIIGKDILRFHAVYWPAFLAGLDLPPPARLYVHGHWQVDHRKMSKSLGNVIDPSDLMDTFGVDATRYALLRMGSVGDEDSNFILEDAKNRVNAELANTMGNLLARCTSPKVMLNPGHVPPFTRSLLRSSDLQLVHMVDALAVDVSEEFAELRFREGIDLIMQCLWRVNQHITEVEPWKMKKEAASDPMVGERLNSIIFIALEALRISGTLLQPIIPGLTSDLLDCLNMLDRERTVEFCEFGKSEVHRPLQPFKDGRSAWFQRIK
jgi:methionyl-tRNA synthetase